MKKSFALMALLMLVQQGVVGDIFLGTASDSKGNRLNWSVEESVFEQSTSWREGEPLPLSMSKLAAAGRKYLQEKYGLGADLPMTSFTIKGADVYGRKEMLKDKWYVTIKYGGEANSNVEKSVRLTLDGTVLKPTVTKEGE